MKNSTVIKFLLILALILVGLGACVKYFVLPAVVSIASKAVSVETEERIGKMMADNMLLDPTVKVVVHPSVDSAMDEVTGRLLQMLEPPRYHYRIQVIESDQINAFTMPGGTIFVYSGLIQLCDRPEQLAAVLAHEIGHAEKRHVVKKIFNDLGIRLLVVWLLGNEEGIWGSLGLSAITSSFDRSQEKEADAYSFQLMEKAGIRPSSSADFFKKVNKVQGNQPAYLEFLMTHPSDESRIKASLAYQVGSGFSEKSFNLRWESIKSALKK